MSKVNQREVALYILMDIWQEEAYSNIVLRKTLRTYNGIGDAEKAFIVELVNGTQRNITYLDYVINHISKTKTTKMKPFILALLRLSAYQILFMDKVPVSAVCNEAVTMVKKRGMVNLAGFVNGVLRNLDRQKGTVKLPRREENPLEYLCVKYSYPQWLLQYWLQEMDYTVEIAEEMCKVNNMPVAPSIAVNTIKTTREKLEKQLIQEDVEIFPGNYPNAIRIKGLGNMVENKGFQEGLFHVMDETSMFAVQQLGIHPGSKMLDVCSAPGGKSFYAAYLMENQGRIVSCDIHQHKLALVEQGAARLGINIIQTSLWDATRFDPLKENAFDCCIIDAPCSGLGLLRKKPDIRWKKQRTDITNLAEIQKDILSTCQNYVKPGGILVYATCTISKEENEDNVQWFLEKFNYEPLEIESSGSHYKQILPTAEGLDGFFIARFKKRGENEDWSMKVE